MIYDKSTRKNKEEQINKTYNELKSLEFLLNGSENLPDKKLINQLKESIDIGADKLSQELMDSLAKYLQKEDNTTIRKEMNILLKIKSYVKSIMHIF